MGRFRVNVFRQRGVIGLAIRRVRAEVPSFEELRLPPVMATLAGSPRGLILITGPTGTGKTTTIASMIGHINRTRRTHIVTVEDPIEVVHDDVLSIIQQREIGIDTDSYATALRHVIRQDPDVIFIGEIRDAESALAAIQAAETGHLVISTLHTIDAMETINRVLDLFPPAAAAGDPLVVRRCAARDRLPAARDTGRRQGTGPGGGGARQHRTRLRPDRGPRGDDGHPRGDRRRRVLRDADLRSGARQLVKEGIVSPDEARRTATNPHDFDLALHGTLERRSAFDDAATAAAEMPYQFSPAPNGHGDPSVGRRDERRG